MPKPSVTGDKPVEVKELSPREAVLFIAAQEIIARGVLAPDTAELIVLFADQPIEVVQLTETFTQQTPQGPVDVQKVSVSISAWFSGKVFNGQWGVQAIAQSFLGLPKGTWPTPVEKALDDGRAKVAQLIKTYLKELAVKAGIMKPGAAGIIKLH